MITCGIVDKVWLIESVKSKERVWYFKVSYHLVNIKLARMNVCNIKCIRICNILCYRNVIISWNVLELAKFCTRIERMNVVRSVKKEKEPEIEPKKHVEAKNTM